MLKVSRRTLCAVAALAMAAASSTLVGTASAGHVNCGDIILEDTTLDSDVGPCQIGLTIGASNVDLDLAGHTVFGTPVNGDGDGITFANVSGSRLRNGTVRDFDAGVFIDHGSNNTVLRTQIRNNPRFEGIWIHRSPGAQILANQVTANGSPAGILVDDAADSVVSGNTVQGNRTGTAIGIWVLNDRDVPATQGEVDVVGLQAERILVADNLVQGNALDGIQISRFAHNNTVRNNNVSQNGVFRTNNARDGSGIIVFGNENLIQDNVMFGNGANGLFISASVSAGRPQGANNTLLRNRAFGNDAGPNLNPSFDLRDGNPNCDNNAWHGNQGQTFTPPCVLNP